MKCFDKIVSPTVRAIIKSIKCDEDVWECKRALLMHKSEAFVVTRDGRIRVSERQDPLPLNPLERLLLSLCVRKSIKKKLAGMDMYQLNEIYQTINDELASLLPARLAPPNSTCVSRPRN